MLASLIPMFFNLPVLIAVIMIALAAVAIFYLEGPAALLADAINPRYWIAVGGIIAIVAFLHAGNVIQQQKQDAAAAATTITAQKDSQAVVTDVSQKKTHNSDVSKQIQSTIATTPVGSQEDAVWDQIARQHDQSGNPPQ